MRRILWGRATSSNVMKAIWTLEELQLAVRAHRCRWLVRQDRHAPTIAR